MSTEAECRKKAVETREPARGLWRKGKVVSRFLLASWKTNLAAAMEYRLGFLLLAGMMFLNNAIWLSFWGLFFRRFPVVHGWELQDIMLLWGISAGGFGWACILFGNFHRIAAIVSSGQLDLYLSQPKPVLLNVLASRMSVTAMGDFAFGVAIYVWVGDHSAAGVFWYGIALLLSGGLFLGVMIVAGCAAFFMGNAEGLSGQVFSSLVSLTTYPSDIFRGIAKMALFTVLPAGFVSYLPIGLLRNADPAFVTAAIAATAALDRRRRAAFPDRTGPICIGQCDGDAGMTPMF